jgi:hypothetical protein
VPLNPLDLPSVAGQKTYLLTLHEGSNAHTRQIESSLAVAKCASPDKRLNPWTASYANHAVRSFVLGRKYLTIPDLSADAMWVPTWLKVSARMAVSCAWRMISKLNVDPFQATKSPLVEPVRIRQLPGVH